MAATHRISTIALTTAERRALAAVRSRYPARPDLFTARELANLCFVRWLFRQEVRAHRDARKYPIDNNSTLVYASRIRTQGALPENHWSRG